MLAAALAALAVPAIAAPTTIVADTRASGSSTYNINTTGACGAGQVAVIAVGGHGGSGLPFTLSDARGNTWVAGTFAKDSTANLRIFRSHLTAGILPGDILTVGTPGTTGTAPFTLGLCFADGSAVGAVEGADPEAGAGTIHNLTMTASASTPSYKVMAAYFRLSWVDRGTLSNVTEAASVTNGGTSGLVMAYVFEPSTSGDTTSEWSTTGAALNVAAWGEVDATGVAGSTSHHQQTLTGIGS
jgi:hypothetical protein